MTGTQVALAIEAANQGNQGKGNATLPSITIRLIK